MLAPYATRPSTSRGRLFVEESPASRGEFQRDRDRIIHSGAFRRLEYKTQVFVNHEGDLFRTRLTHSLEVAQIARSIARNLSLNEDLVEAISLAHDLGHTPFGHAGQDALNTCMTAYGGFEHNMQSLRVVDVLEERYGLFDGLNLMFETREGILKRCPPEKAANLGDIGERFIRGWQPSLEAQLTNLVDEIAYSNHDIDDGLRSGLITIEQLENIELFVSSWQEVHTLLPNIKGRRAIHETVRRMINVQILDVIETSQNQIVSSHVASLDDVRRAPALMMFSSETRLKIDKLKTFLNENLYHHYQVERMTNKARKLIQSLFDAFMNNPNLLPSDYRLAPTGQEAGQARKVADYIAGMTDRYAIREYRRLFDWEEN